MKVQASTVIKNLFMRGEVVTLNHQITYEEAEEIALEYNCIAEMEEKVDLVAELLKEDEEDESLMKKRQLSSSFYQTALLSRNLLIR